MPDFVLTFLLLGVPLLTGIAGCVLVWSPYADLKSRPEEADAVGTARGRLPVFFALAALPFVFGFELWFLITGIEAEYGALQGPSYTAASWMALGYAAVAVLVVASQTWLARARLRDFISVNFGRILPVMVVPNTSLVFALVLGFLAVGRLPDILTGPAGVAAAVAGQITVVFQVYALAALGNLVGIGLSLRVRDFTTPQGFMRMTSIAEIGAFLPILALVWGFLQLGSV